MHHSQDFLNCGPVSWTLESNCNKRHGSSSKVIILFYCLYCHVAISLLLAKWTNTAINTRKDLLFKDLTVQTDGWREIKMKGREIFFVQLGTFCSFKYYFLDESEFFLVVWNSSMRRPKTETLKECNTASCRYIKGRKFYCSRQGWKYINLRKTVDLMRL